MALLLAVLARASKVRQSMVGDQSKAERQHQHQQQHQHQHPGNRNDMTRSYRTVLFSEAFRHSLPGPRAALNHVICAYHGVRRMVLCCGVSFHSLDGTLDTTH